MDRRISTKPKFAAIALRLSYTVSELIYTNYIFADSYYGAGDLRLISKK